MGNYEVGPYLEEMKDEIEISYPLDMLAIISERKRVAAAGSNSSSVQSEVGNVTLDPALTLVQSLLDSITTESALHSAPFTFDQAKTSSAIGK